MSDETPAALLMAELELGEALVETLERQRSALIENDIDQINELTELLETRLSLFMRLLQKRFQPPEVSTAASNSDRELRDRVRRTEVRVMELADFNEKLIADRLAWSGAMLAALGMTEPGPGYRPGSSSDPHPRATVRRSA